MNFLFASKDFIERSNTKVPFVRRRPLELVFPFTSHSREREDVFFEVLSYKSFYLIDVIFMWNVKAKA
jgi:hypothetical protein